MFIRGGGDRRSDSRPQPADERKKEQEYYPHLVVAGPEVADVGHLKVADLRAALLLRQAGGGVLACVFVAMVEEQEHGSHKEDNAFDDKRHTARLPELNMGGSLLEN